MLYLGQVQNRVFSMPLACINCSMNRVSLKNWFLIGYLGIVVLGSCTQPGEALTDRKKRENEAEIAQYIATNNLTGQVQKTDNGTSYLITKANPSGQVANVGDEVKYHYVLRRLFDNLIVDSTDIAANRPLTFTRGVYLNMAAGLYDGIVNSGAVKTGTERVGLRKGESATLLIPSYLNSGRAGTLLLPQYSPVRYDVTVVNVRSEDQQIQEFLAAGKLTPTFSETSGVRVIVTKAQPDSVQITTGKTVTATYKGYFLDGKVFFDSGASPISAQIGANSVVPGFDQGLSKLRQGEKATIIFPSALGYGIAGSRNSSGVYTVPPYSPLAFDVTITSVK